MSKSNSKLKWNDKCVFCCYFFIGWLLKRSLPSNLKFIEKCKPTMFYTCGVFYKFLYNRGYSGSNLQWVLDFLCKSGCPYIFSIISQESFAKGNISKKKEIVKEFWNCKWKWNLPTLFFSFPKNLSTRFIRPLQTLHFVELFTIICTCSSKAAVVSSAMFKVIASTESSILSILVCKFSKSTSMFCSSWLWYSW